jgi:hypothetical protein
VSRERGAILYLAPGQASPTFAHGVDAKLLCLATSLCIGVQYGVPLKGKKRMTNEYGPSDKDIAESLTQPGSAADGQINRVLQLRMRGALTTVSEKLTGVTETIYRTSQGFQERAEQFTARMDELLKLYSKISEGQTRQQGVILALTLVIALSTVAYTWITRQSVVAMREANEIQRLILKTPQK